MNNLSERFIDKVKRKANVKHVNINGDLIYDYSKTIYIKSSQHVIITCLLHGDFKQTPANHLTGNACPKCNIKAALTTNEFITRAVNVHGTLYDYSMALYISSNIKIDIICNTHGKFKQTPNAHLSGQGCPLCGGTCKRTVGNFIDKSNILHSNLYDYSLVQYSNGLTKVDIICSIHGIFKQTPNSHLEGQGCPKCAHLICGYNKTSFISRCNNNSDGLGVLYIIECYNNSEQFYKVGITSKSVRNRFANNTHMPYNISIIREYRLLPECAYDLENIVLREFAQYSYNPEINFGGSTECFSICAPVVKFLNAKIKD